MKHLMIALMLIAVSACATKPEQGKTVKHTFEDVTITWQSIETYRDIRAADSIQRKFEDRVVKQITKATAKAARRHLAEGETLEMVVTNLDLAGDVKPTFGLASRDIRIVEALYPPAIDFSYQLKRDGKVLKSGNETLRYLGFDHSVRNIGSSRHNYYYEVEMLSRWMGKTL